ncbi:xanthine dehydrogenase family protein molybdopterin-binding subunit [Anaerolineae bacterium CFX7]|nr:xanthine dehydrogenase family protein molybdopterin-binding subunit [Anaerolineae bacterium CFX7]
MSDFSVIGKRVPKLDALDKATGRAQYGHDLDLPGTLVGKILYANVPHARIVNIDTSRAEKVRGVKAVLTGKHSGAHKFGYGGDNTPLKEDKVRCRRDEIAAVAAMDDDAADEALELIRVEYEELPPLFSAEAALAPGAPLVHEDRADNLFLRYNYAHGDAERAFDEADEIIEQEFFLPYVTHAAMETSFALAAFDLQNRLTLWSTTQIPFLLQRDLSEALGIPGRDIRVIQPVIGGAFGRGLDVYPFEPICALLAKYSGKPVRIAFTREEEFFATAARQPARVKMRSAAKRDGTLWAREAHALLDAGAYISWGAVTPLVMMETVASLYRVPHAKFVADVVYSNNIPTGAMRGYGNPQSTFFVETQMDILAEKLGMDPVEFRLRNANVPNSETPQGLKITSCGLRECITEVAERIGWERRAGPNSESRLVNAHPPQETLQIQTRNPKIKRGIGIACTLNVGGGARIYRSDGCGATVKVDDFGRVTLISGSTEIGQGSETALAQIVAETLGVRVDDVTVINSDTSVKPWDVGTHASRTTFIAGNAAWIAANEVREKILDHAAQMLNVPANQLEMRDRQVRVRGDGKGVAFDKVVRAMHYREDGVVVSGTGWYDPPTKLVDKHTYKGNISAAYGFGAQAVEVEVDTETGQVRVLKIVAAHDVGRAINPMYVEGQIEGGAQMGVGYALTEELQVREGRVLNPTLLDYRMPTALDMPPIESVIVETADPAGPFGAKGVGEMGGNPTAAAIANAVYNAIGIRLNQLPMTGERVLRALQEKERSAARD